jgi:hypothetical protein
MHRRIVAPGVMLAIGSSCSLALFACSLTLPGETSYFGSAESSSSSSSGDASLNDSSPGDEGGKQEAAVDAPGTSDSGADSAMGADADGGLADSGSDAMGADSATPFDAAVLDPAVLAVWYPFETIENDAGDGDADTPTTPDMSGNGLNGEVLGYESPDSGVVGTPPSLDPLGHSGNALKLDATKSQYVQLPSGVLSTFNKGMSVSCWVKLHSGAIWDRLFDFNTPGAPINWIYFSPTGWNPTTMAPGTHFAVAGQGNLDPEMILTQTILVGGWHHVALVFDPPYVLYFLDGQMQYFADNMKTGVEPSTLGNTFQNWLGRSSYPSDPFLDATIDEFRLYSGGLTPAQVAQLATQ